jgi:cholesterol oxidase
MPVSTRKLGLHFTEKMAGFLAGDNDAKDTPAALKNGSPFEFLLTVSTDDLDRMLSEKAHAARLDGTVTAPALSREPMTVTDGLFNLFIADQDAVAVKELRYTMTMCSRSGERYFFQGIKTVRAGSPLNLWAETTTLAITVWKGDSEAGPLIGRGILHLSADEFARELTTIEVTNAENSWQRLDAIVRFGKFFAGELFDSYGGVFARPAAFNPAASPRQRRPLRVAAPEVHFFATADGLVLRLTRYRGGDKGPVMLVHGLGVSSLIFAIDTIETNLLEYLFANGYDVWLLDYRSSIELPYVAGPYTGDDVAVYDYPAAVERVRQLTRVADIQVLVHCFGATTFFLAMLSGLRGVRAAAVSQIAAHAVVPAMTHVMSGAHVPEILDKVLGVADLSAQTASIGTNVWKMHSCGSFR